MKFNEKLKILRKTRGYTQKKFCKKLDIGYSTLGHYEAARIQPTQEVISKLAKEFPDAVMWLLRDDEDTTTPQVNISGDKNVNVIGNNRDVKIDNRKNIINVISNNAKIGFIDDEAKTILIELKEKIYLKRSVKGSVKERNLFIWTKLNQYMGVTSYKEITKKDYYKAHSFLQNWLNNWSGKANKETKKTIKYILEANKQYNTDKNEYFNFLKDEFNTVYLKDLTLSELNYVYDWAETGEPQ